MNPGFGLNYNTNFYMVRDSGHVPPGMDCIQLQLQPPQLRTQPFHYLINEQAKSLLALQELQNEVGALLEFRDLVMETFPNLRQKMSGSSSQTFSNTQNYCSNLPLPLSGSLNSRYWEPGIRVKRKIVNKSENDNSFVRVRAGSKIQSNQPKSSEAISGVQDSGFSTETNSSNKDHVSSTATSVPLPVQTDDPFLSRKEGGSHKESPRAEYDRSDEEFSEDGLVMKVNEAEEELWNLLDVIHTKGTKLQEEVETLQLRLMVEEIENHVNSKELELRKVRRKFHRRCRSLENVSEGTSSLDLYLANVEALQPSNFKFNELSFEEDVFRKKQMTRSIEMEDIDQIRQERNLLLDKLTEMESEKVASRKKTSELQHEISVLISTKEELQEQLFQAVKQKTELNSRINELHMKFVTGDKKWRVGTGSTTDRSTTKDLTDSESSSQTEKLSLIRSKSTDDTQKILNGDRCWVKRESLDFENVVNKLNLTKNLGTLDGILTNPMETRKCIKLTENSRKKVTAILKEKNYLELQRHLLVSIVQNQILNNQLELSAKSKDDLYQQLDKYKKENDELLFQLEERNIELEGTRAQVRVLEKYQHHPKPETISRKVESSKSEENFTFLENDHLRSKGFSESEINRARQIFLESQSKKVDKSEIVKILNRTKNVSPQRQSDLNNSFDLDKTGSVIPTMALPWPIMASHQSSGTESTQALEISSELEADMARVDKCDSMRNEKSPYKRRPSKIPLNIQKTSKSLKSVTSESGSSYLKKSDGDLNRSKDLNISLKKCSLDNSNISVMSRSPPQNPTSIRYSSVGRTGSQLSMASQKSQTQSSVASKSDKRKSLTNGAQREESSLSSTKNPSLKQTTNFSSVRQRDTLTRKGQNDSWDGHGKKTLRTSLRDSFRSKVSNDGTQSAGKKESSLTGVRKDSVQQRQTRPNPSQQQKTNISKTIMSTDGDSTKLPDERPEATLLHSKEDKILHRNEEHESKSSRTPSPKLDSDIFTDSLNTSPQPLEVKAQTPPPSTNYLFREVRQNFQKKLAEKFSQTFYGRKLFPSSSQVFDRQMETESHSNVKKHTEFGRNYDFTESKTVDIGDPLGVNDSKEETGEIHFYDSIYGSIEEDKSDSLLINSSYDWNKSLTELDSLEV